MKVLHVSGARSWGGNEQQLIYLVDEMARLGVTQKVFCFTGTPLHRELAARPVDVLDIEFAKPFASPYRTHFKNIVINGSIDLVHLHTSDAVTGYVLTDLLSSLNIPTVFSRKGVRKKTGIFSRLKYNYRNIDKILCVSKYVEDNFREILGERNQQKLITVYDGVKAEKNAHQADFQIREKLGLQEDVFLIGNIANHTAAKDLPVLVETLHILINKYNFRKVHLVQIGSFTRLTPALKDRIEELELKPYITLMGFLEEASAYQSQFDVFLMTSEREGGPSSVLEAFKNQVPVVSTEVGVVEEVIKDGYNGFSAEVKNPEEIAEKLYTFATTPGLAEEFSKRSYEMFLSTFTAEKLGIETLRVYREVLKNFRR